MPYTKLPQSSHNVFLQRQQSLNQQQAHRGVRQDKRAFASARTAARQAAPDTKGIRAQQVKQKRVRSHINFTLHQKAVKVTAWVKPGVKAELERLAKQEGLSVSATSAALLEEAVRQKLHVQHAVLLQPLIEQAIRQQMKGISTKLAWLLVRVAFDAGQTRSLVTNILSRQPGMTEPMLKNLMINSSKTAKGNITRKTPQLTDLMEAVEQWLVADNEGDKPT
jgi:hypothetical protein